MITIKINKRFLETCGTGTLFGEVTYKQYEPYSLIKDLLGQEEDKNVLIQFEQTSLEYRRKNKGPKLYIMPEYAVMCFTQDIVELISRGYNIKVEKIIVKDEI